MQCEKFDLRMNLLLDHRQKPEHDPQLQSHAQVCSGCREQLEHQAALFEGLATFFTPREEDGLVDQIVERACRETRPRQRKESSLKRHWFWAVAATMASAAMLIVIPLLRSSTRDYPAPHLANGGVGSSAELDGRLANLDTTEIQSFIKEIPTRFSGMDKTFAPPLKPITTSFGVAIDALRRSIPGGRNEKRAEPQAWNLQSGLGNV